jgi:hypothetical protein
MTARRIRVTTGLGTRERALHPGGRATMRPAGQTWTCALTFEEMLEGDRVASFTRTDSPCTRVREASVVRRVRGS